jgi:hypothetical protein
MEENMTTLNTSEEIVESSATANDRPAFDPDSIGIIHDREGETTELNTSKETIKQDAEDAGKGEEKETPEPKKDATSEGDETRFDKHPRWQQMLQEREQAKQTAEQERIARAKLEGELEALRRQPPVEKAPAKADYKDITALTAEEIAEWQATDPKGFAANMYAQVKAEAMTQMQESLRAEREQEKNRISIEKTYKEFEDKHKDFKPMWDSGEIVKFIEANPGHNPISAYQAMTYETRMQKAIEEARAKAIKETEEKVNKNWQAKRTARVLGAGPSGAGTETEDKELKDVKTQGGLYNVLAKRLDRLRAAH